MRLYLNTSTEKCEIWLGSSYYSWLAKRELSVKLLKFLQDSLAKEDGDFSSISSIVVFRGPGSYTSLRIGLTVANTLAQSLSVPIVGTIHENWRSEGDERLAEAQSDEIVTPIYLQPAVITKPRK